VSKALFSDACVTAFIILVWLVTGVTLLQGLANYPTWLDMGPMMSNDDFRRLREAHYWKIYPLAVYPGMISLILNIVLIWLRPRGISSWLLVASLVIGLVIGLATFLVQVPLQDRIDASGYDRDVVQRLIDTDFWTRKLPGYAGMAIGALLTWQAVRRPAASPPG
jgi:hypothetical protein